MLALHNFATGTVSQGYDASATSIALTSGHGARFPSTGPFRCVWWNKTDYPDPANDPNREIVEVTARSTDTLTIRRGMETADGGLAASTKNASARVYGFTQVYTGQSPFRSVNRPDRVVSFFDDFLYRAAQIASSDCWWGMIDNNHFTYNWARDDSKPSGITGKQSGYVRILTDAATTRSGGHQLILSFGAWGPYITGGEMTFECVLFPPNEALSDGTNDYTLRIGLGLQATTYDVAADGIWFEYSHDINSGNWRGVTRQGGSASNVDSSVAVAAGTEVRLKWVRNSAANSVEFFVNGVSVGSASSNVFADNVHCGLFMHMDRAAGTARRNLWVDWVQFSQCFDSR